MLKVGLLSVAKYSGNSISTLLVVFPDFRARCFLEPTEQSVSFVYCFLYCGSDPGYFVLSAFDAGQESMLI